MLNLIQPVKNAAQYRPQLFLPICYVIDFSFKDGTLFIKPSGDLVDIVAQAAHQANRIMQLWQVQLQHISIQGHGADKCRLVFDSEGFHLSLNDGVLFRRCFEAVVSCSELCGFSFLSLCSLQSLKFVCYAGFRPAFISLLLVRAYFSLLPLSRNLVWLTTGPFGAPFRRGRSSRFGQIWKRGPGCQGALRWRCQRMMRENSSPMNGENQRFWKHLRKILLPGRNSRCTFSQTPLTPTWEKSGKLTPPPENFFST